MTQSTEQERATFEAWYIAGVRQRKAAFSTWSDVEIRDGCMAPSNEGYRVDNARTAWDAWQAARRAPAAPVPQGLLEAAQRAHDWMDLQADSQSKGNYHSFDLFCLRQERDALAEALYAAPQPPEATVKQQLTVEAAPVQLPEPVGVMAPWPLDPSRDYIEWANESPARGTALYTEQQVRELLAAHGIEVAS